VAQHLVRSAVYSVLTLLLALVACENPTGPSGTTPVPAKIQNLSIEQVGTDVVLSWDEPSDADYDHVYIWYTGTTAAIEIQRGTTTATVSGLPPRTYEYTFWVRTVDGEGNRSEAAEIRIVVTAIPRVSAPSLTPTPGTYTEPQTVTIATVTEGAVIFYRIGGEGQWIEYSGPIVVNESVTIQCYAVCEGMANSTITAGEYDLWHLLQLETPYVADNGLTVTLQRFLVTEKTGSYQYTIWYDEENQTTDQAIDEGFFKLYYKDEPGGLPQYGFFSKLYPGDKLSRIYTFEELKTKPASIIEYHSSNFFSESPLLDSLKWEVSVPEGTE